MADALSPPDQAPEPPDAGERFVRLFAQNHQRILAYIYSLVPRIQDAEDICQKTSLVLWRKIDQVAPEGDFFVWACRVAYLEVRNFRRTVARERLCFNDELISLLAEERPAQLPEPNARLAALEACVKKLNSSQQELVRQAYAGDESLCELAARLGRAVQTIYNRLFRIRQMLLDCVERRIAADEVPS